jgi:hypothetical protein
MTIQFVCKDGTAILNPYYLYIAELLVHVLVQQVYFSIICIINSLSSLIPITNVVLVGYLNSDIEGVLVEVLKDCKEGVFLYQHAVQECFNSKWNFSFSVPRSLFLIILVRLCGPGYRSRGPGSIPGATRFSEK